MAEFIEVPGGGELESGQMKTFNIGGREILLARVGETFYACDNRCPHMGGSLARGKLEGAVVTCPRHHSRFDLTDGHVVAWTDWSGIKLSLAKIFKSPAPVRTYQVKVDEGKVYVGSEKVPAAA